MFLPPASAVEVIESVCVSVIQQLQAEPFDVLTKNLTCRSTWTISRPSSMVKVKCQGHQVRKCDFSGNSADLFF